jgi:hypothetical protein
MSSRIQNAKYLSASALLVIWLTSSVFNICPGQVILSDALAGKASIMINPKYQTRAFNKVFFYTDIPFLTTDWQEKIINDFLRSGLLIQNIKPFLSPLRKYSLEAIKQIALNEGGDGILLLTEKYSDKQWAPGVLSNSGSRTKEYLSLILIDSKLDDYAFSAELESRRGGSADSPERVVRRTVHLVAYGGVQQKLFLYQPYTKE